MRSVTSVCEVRELCVKFFSNEQSFQIHFLSMVPSKTLKITRVNVNAIRKGSLSGGGPLPSLKPVSVSLERVDPEQESRPPPLSEDGSAPLSGDGSNPLSGDGTAPGGGPSSQGTGSANQSSDVE